MSYDSTTFNPGPRDPGKRGSAISLAGGDVTLGTTVKAVVVVAAGNVIYTPLLDPLNTITITGATVGMKLPHIPGKIVATGTTATLATVED